MTRRIWFAGLLATAALGLLLALWLGLSPTGSARLDRGLWDDFAKRFVTAEGRVIDRENGGITHTEGQGYGMLLAEAAGDRKRFELIWDWTRDHLRRPDGLFSWRYGDCGKAGGCVTDRNDASDGDILIAWALLRAGDHWRRSDYRDAARAIATSVADHLVVRLGDRTLLLPGAEGFTGDSWAVVNPSYWVFPAFDDFASAFHAEIWKALSDSGYALLRQARFGRWKLPTDWVRVDAATAEPAGNFPPQYGFNAVRVPLHLLWARQTPADLLEPFRAFWSASHPDHVPAWVDVTNDAVAPYGWQTGMMAIATLGGWGAGGAQPMKLPEPRADEGYYSWSLALLSRVAAAEKRQ